MEAAKVKSSQRGLSSARTGVCPIWIGTSGYSYTEWVDAGFYPAGTGAGAMLPLYAQRFPVTELNHTWYQMPRADAIERQRRKVSPEFLFTAKLTRTLTHEVDARAWPEQAAAYRDGVSPLLQSGQLAAVLIQLPPAFDRSAANRHHLAALLEALDGLPLAVEFRNATWAHDRVFDELSRRRVTLVAVDEPALPGLFPALPVVTNPDLFYIRFHGRNVRGWRSGRMQLQFDYDYTDAELEEWVEQRIEAMIRHARRGVVFFNNHVRGQAPRNAEAMSRLLRQRGLTVV
jgi:uncharacterized protein YecE (DUF72 family)